VTIQNDQKSWIEYEIMLGSWLLERDTSLLDSMSWDAGLRSTDEYAWHPATGYPIYKLSGGTANDLATSHTEVLERLIPGEQCSECVQLSLTNTARLVL